MSHNNVNSNVDDSQGSFERETMMNDQNIIRAKPIVESTVTKELNSSEQTIGLPESVAGSLKVKTGETPVVKQFNLDKVLAFMVEKGASDVHLTVGAPVKFRLNGKLTPVTKFIMTEKEITNVLERILTPMQKETFEKTSELDFAYELETGERFRVNYFMQKNHMGAVMRHISTNIRSLEELKMPGQVARFADFPRGLVLVTGPTGSGKSTTLAAILDLINRKREAHIMTIEDPIEYIHEHKKSNVNQRQVGADTQSFAQALKHVLRQDPDVILVGELRDMETISIALTAAETGHLVLASLHTQSSAQTIDRIIDVFPPEQQSQVKTQLASTLQAVLCQTLLPTIDKQSRIVATEIMFVNSAVSNMIREGKSHQIYSALQAGKANGMHTMDQSLADLVNQQRITFEDSLEAVHEIKTFKTMINDSLKNDFSDNENENWSDMSNVDFDLYKAPGM